MLEILVVQCYLKIVISKVLIIDYDSRMTLSFPYKVVLFQIMSTSFKKPSIICKQRRRRYEDHACAGTHKENMKTLCDKDMCCIHVRSKKISGYACACGYNQTNLNSIKSKLTNQFFFFYVQVQNEQNVPKKFILFEYLKTKQKNSILK